MDRERILKRLEFVYGPEAAARTLPAVEKLVENWRGKVPPRGAGWSERDALLIAYADSVVENGRPPLAVLADFLREAAGDLVSFVHLLPFYPYTSDDGFAVTDFRAVREELGSWADVERLSRDYRLVFDGVINHVSSESGYMRGYCRGDEEFADFFISLPPLTDTSSVLRTRNLPLLHDYETSAGPRWLWTTFSRDQVDLNFGNPRVLLEVLDVLLFYAARGAAALRLDAIPYLWKELGTSCAHLPQTHEMIRLFRDVMDAAAPGTLLLAEANAPHAENVTYLGSGGDEAQMVYNFALPPLILFSIVSGDARKLTEWAKGVRPAGDRATYLNITATHDGIGMRPTEGLLTENERKMLTRLAKAHGGDVSGKLNPDGSVSPYELNLSYFDAVNDPRAAEPLDVQIDRFMLSQAMVLSFLGIPGIYVHSLIGSRNDLEGVRRTKRARSINRQQLDLGTLRRELADPQSLRARVLSRYLRLLEARRAQPAFAPGADQEVLSIAPALFALRRRAADGRTVLAVHNVSGHGVCLDARKLPEGAGCTDLLTGESHVGAILLAPYAVRWLVPAADR